MLPHSLAGQFLCPWRQSPIRVGLGRYESQQALTQIGNKGEAGTRLKIPPWRSAPNPLPVWEHRGMRTNGRTKDGKCCRPQQASPTAHIPGSTVLSSTFSLPTARRDALGGNTCTSTSVAPQRWLGFSKAIDQTRKRAQVCWESATMGQFYLKNFLKSGESKSYITLVLQRGSLNYQPHRSSKHLSLRRKQILFCSWPGLAVFLLRQPDLLLDEVIYCPTQCQVCRIRKSGRLSCCSPI